MAKPAGSSVGVPLNPVYVPGSCPYSHAWYGIDERECRMTLLRWAIILAVLAIIAAIFGFGGIASGLASVAKFLFFLFLIGIILLIIAGIAVGRKIT